MERYSAIKQLAVTSAELIEQVQFGDYHAGAGGGRRPGSLKNKLVSERKHGKRRKIGKNLLFFVFKAGKIEFSANIVSERSD